MNRTAYIYARAMIRANGLYKGIRKLRMSEASIMLRLANQRPDTLANRVTDADVYRMAQTLGY
jgi:hypothetical protein